MSDDFSTGLTVIVCGVAGMFWAFYTIKRDFKKPKFKSRNFMIGVAGVCALVIALSGVARMFR